MLGGFTEDFESGAERRRTGAEIGTRGVVVKCGWMSRCRRFVGPCAKAPNSVSARGWRWGTSVLERTDRRDLNRGTGISPQESDDFRRNARVGFPITREMSKSARKRVPKY